MSEPLVIIGNGMMAAMAQQDCGQCGYDCKNYSGAIHSGKEERLNLCVPGGKETARTLKALFEEFKSAPVKPAAEAAKPVSPPAAISGGSRDNPAEAVFVSRARLNKPGSAKETWHLEFDLSAWVVCFWETLGRSHNGIRSRLSSRAKLRVSRSGARCFLASRQRALPTPDRSFAPVSASA